MRYAASVLRTIVRRIRPRRTYIHIHINEGAYADGSAIDALSQAIAWRIRKENN